MRMVLKLLAKSGLMKLTAKPFPLVAAVVLHMYWPRVRDALSKAYQAYCVDVKSELSDMLVVALIAAEDHRFFEHCGIDFLGIMRALYRNLCTGGLEGASTIEQQLVRQLTGKFEKTFRRKVSEILLASLVFRVIPKWEIPGVYLSVAYFGWQMNGIRQACVRLGVDSRNASPRQAAALMARLKYPEPRALTPGRAHLIARRTEYIWQRFAVADDVPCSCQLQLEMKKSAAFSGPRIIR